MTKAGLVGTALAVILAACAGHRSRTPQAAIVDTVPIRPAAVLGLDAGPSPASAERLGLFRSYFALERVGIPAHHFTVWYRKIEPAHCRVVVLDANTAKTSGCMWGGMSVRPSSIPPVPANVHALGEAAQDAVREEEPDAKDFAIRYEGVFRELVVSEFIPMVAVPNGLSGWYGKLHLRADPGLTRFVDKVRDGESGFGAVEIPASAARLDVKAPSNENGKSLITDAMMSADPQSILTGRAGTPRTYLERALSIARDIASGKPVPTMAPLLAAGIDTSLPEGYSVPVHVKLSVLAWLRKPGNNPNPRLELDIPLQWRDTVEPGGQTRGTTEGDIAGLHVRASATLGSMVPAAPLPYAPAAPWRSVEMSLTVRVEDGRGHVFERSYPAHGNILVEGRSAATIGFVLPDYGSSNHDRETLKVTWPGNPQAGAFDVQLNRELGFDPRPSRVK
ncbi:hypothetical protein LZC95_06520 [Pendulispora brunnea]|uniref:Uncharacterized protein n=1 Tax=Pendulispora brunnea TaxID=2905690 RepID=A0ABZ2KCV2_9BACT